MAEKSRRKLIKGLGVSIPTAWAAPIIEAVILPAHATTTGECDELECDDSGWINGDGNGGSVAEEFLDYTDSRCECEALVKCKRPTANGATWGFLAGASPRECYAEFEWSCPPSASSSWETKSFERIGCDG